MFTCQALASIIALRCNKLGLQCQKHIYGGIDFPTIIQDIGSTIPSSFSIS